MQKIIYKSDSRGHVNFGWLDSNHSFSFGHYYNPDRMNFGLLRVLNDDLVAGGAGFPTHPHSNMEIVSIPLKGSLAHRDSTGSEKVIKAGEVQIMSAGSGLTHSEYNYSKTEEVNFLQIWILPKEMNINPRYDQKEFSVLERQNSFQTIVSPSDRNALWINQDAWLSLAEIDKGRRLTYKFHNHNSGLYLFLIEGEISIGNEHLKRRDAIGVWETSYSEINAIEHSKLLLIEVPIK